MIPFKLLFRLARSICRLPARGTRVITRVILLLGALAAIFQLLIELYRRVPAFRRVGDRVIDAWMAKPPDLGGSREVGLDGNEIS